MRAGETAPRSVFGIWNKLYNDSYKIWVLAGEWGKGAGSASKKKTANQREEKLLENVQSPIAVPQRYRTASGVIEQSSTKPALPLNYVSWEEHRTDLEKTLITLMRLRRATPASALSAVFFLVGLELWKHIVILFMSKANSRLSFHPPPLENANIQRRQKPTR